MKLTALDIKQQTFEKSLRGYDTAEVEAFLKLVSTEWEQVITKQRELESEISTLKDRVKHYERVEEALHETLQTAKESANQKLSAAKVEAKSTIEKAEIEADGIVREAHQKRQEIRQSILRLIDKREEIISSIRSYLQNAQDSLNNFSKDESDIFKLPKDEPSEAKPSHKVNIQLDEEDQDQDMQREKSNLEPGNDSHAYPPGSERLDDILDEID